MLGLVGGPLAPGGGRHRASPIRRRRARAASYHIHSGRRRMGAGSGRAFGQAGPAAAWLLWWPSSKQKHIYVIPSVLHAASSKYFLPAAPAPTQLATRLLVGSWSLNSSFLIPGAALATSQPPRVTSEFWSPKTASVDPWRRRARQGRRSLQNGRLQLEGRPRRHFSGTRPERREPRRARLLGRALEARHDRGRCV